MPVQTTKEQYIFPDGMALEVSTDSGSSWTNLGTFAAGATMTHNFDKQELESGNNGKVISNIKNETVEIAPSALWTWDLDAIQKLGGGIYTVTNVAGTPVAGATQTIASGSWAYNKFIQITNQNGDGSEITINSVTLGTDGAIVEDTDYYKGQNAAGAWGIFVIDSATVTTENQTVEIDYDYTPSQGKTLKSGSQSVVLTRYQARLRHYTDAPLTTYDIEMIIFSTDVNAGLSFAFKGANEEGLNEITLSLTGNVDTSLTDGEGLFSLFVAESAKTSV